MADFQYLRASVARKVEESEPGSALIPADRPNPAGKYCAYNQTRQRFLCANVEVSDSSMAHLDSRLLSLASATGAALWIVPIQVISPTSVRVPLDLVYLDRSSVVLDCVESFPLAQPVAAGAATSILALPSQTVRSTGTRPGDRLILCTPDEMKLRLQQMAEEKPGVAVQTSPGAAGDQLAPKASGNVLQFVDRANPRPAELHPTEIVPVPPVPAPPAPTLPIPALSLAPIPPAAAAARATPAQATEKPAPRWKVADSRSWLERLLEPEPPDPRSAPRESLTGLVAYFFTGGRPVAQNVRNISATGVYVVTEERWYPGTVVRMTLTDQRDPTSERSVTVNAKVIRATEDGVGFQFLLKDGKEGRGSSTPGVDNQAQGVYRAQIEEFLQRLKGSKL